MHPAGPCDEPFERQDRTDNRRRTRHRPGLRHLVGASVPIGRVATAEDLTGMAVFLASADSDYVVAQTFNVDGGNWMS